MRLFNKFIWSKKEPSNKNDVWFDGSTWRMYTEEAWQSFTLPVDAADKVAKVIENVSEVYQEKLNAGEGIVIEDNTISIIIDPKLSETSNNPVQNKTVTKALKEKINKTELATINGKSIIGGEDIIIKEGKPEIIIDFRKLGEPIETENEGASMKYSKEQFENAVGMSISEFFEKSKTSEIILGVDNSTIIPYYIVFNEFQWFGYYKVPGLINYVIAIDAKSPNEPMILSVHYETADLPFATTEYVDEKNAQVENKLTELEEENERLKERIEEQDLFIEDLQNTKIDRENDDYYPKMAVGLADNLAGVDVVDSEINFRRSGGGAISDGVARIESIKGNSVVWNQKIDPNLLGIITAELTDNGDELIIVPTANNNRYGCNVNVVGGHYYLQSVDIRSENGARVGFQNYLHLDVTDKTTSTSYVRLSKIAQASSSGGSYVQLYGMENGAYRIRKGSFVLRDLTQMFGAGNEPTTIEEFYARIPMGVDLNAYNEGEVIHMDVQSIESQGVNAWDEQWELGTITEDGTDYPPQAIFRPKGYIKVLPNTQYAITSPSHQVLYVFYFDSNKGLISFKYFERVVVGEVITTPANCAYLRFIAVLGSTYNNDICINLSDTSINGNYYPYIKRVEDLSIIRKYFPDGMKSAGTAHDEIRYNKASGKWEKVVRIGVVDMGTLNFAYETNGGFFYNKLEGVKASSSWLEEGNLLSGLYSITYANAIAQTGATPVNMSIALGPNGMLYVVNTSHSDVASFKAAMSGVMLYYELAEPIVTELDDEDQFKDLDYKVWNAGTEKAIAEGKSAPLAADITYGFNAIGKIKELEEAIKALQTKVASL